MKRGSSVDREGLSQDQYHRKAESISGESLRRGWAQDSPALHDPRGETGLAGPLASLEDIELRAFALVLRMAW